MSDPQRILGPLGWVGTGLLAATLLSCLLNPRIRAMARLTLLDNIRRMEFQAICLLGLVLIAGMGWLLFTPGITNMPLWGVVVNRVAETGPEGVNVDAHQQFLKDFPYYMQSAMAFFAEVFTLFITMALGLFMLSQDRQDGLLLTLLPKPISRGEYLWGRGLGVIFTVNAAWVLMGIEIFLIFCIKNPAALTDVSQPEWKILITAGLLTMKWTSLVAILFMGTLRLPPIAGGFATLLLFVGGHLAGNIHDVATDLAANSFVRGFAWFGYVITPHYDRAWSAIILDPAINAFQGATDYAGFLGWAWTYSMVCGLWAWWIFRRRDV